MRGDLFDLTWRFNTLLVFSLSCIAVGVGLENTIGTDFATILGEIGGTSFMTYFVRLNFDRGTPKFVGARKYLNIGLVVLWIGTLVVSIASVENILSSSGLAGIPLKIVGTGIFVSGAVGLILALVLVEPKPYGMD